MGATETTLAFFSGGIGMPEIIMVMAVGLLVFGRRLPEVGRSVGKSIVEFKRGLRGIEDEVDDAVDEPESRSRYLPPKENQDNDETAKPEPDPAKAKAAE